MGLQAIPLPCSAGGSFRRVGHNGRRMDERELTELVEGVRNGTVAPDDAVARLRRLPFAEVGDTLVDHHRSLRQGMPEVVYGRGKSADQCTEIVGELLAHGTGAVLLTRVDDTTAATVMSVHPYGDRRAGGVLWRRPHPHRTSKVLVISAGTSDVPVVDECVLTLQAFGFHPDRLTDVGVAGLHRLLAHVDRVTSADALVVVAGMEGALASVIGGLTSVPVVAVPTSVGYGAGLDGVTALLAMHASCASGITVVGIDNGFGAACAIARMCP
jgi:pyridinium-3,5-biscarboxylic acid mononucleotide synthase